MRKSCKCPVCKQRVVVKSMQKYLRIRSMEKLLETDLLDTLLSNAEDQALEELAESKEEKRDRLIREKEDSTNWDGLTEEW